jgi:hypothetical protein
MELVVSLVGLLVGGLVGWLEVLIDFRPDYVFNDRRKADPYLHILLPFLWTSVSKDLMCVHCNGDPSLQGW